MVKVKSSLADLLRNHINSKLSESFDYSLAHNRKQDIQNFIDSHQNDLSKEQSNIKTIRPSHNKILDDCLKNKGIDPQALGRKSKKPKFSGDLNPKITPEPQAGKSDTTPSKTPVPQQGGQAVTPQVGDTNAPVNFDEESVGATWQSLVLMFRIAYPDIELLSDQEKTSLGKIWLPLFNKYLTGKYIEIVVPIFATAGILFPKITNARKKKKLRKETETPEPAKVDPKEIEKIIKEERIDVKPTVEEQIQHNDNLPSSVPKIGTVSSEIILPKKENE